ncbi:MAG: nucleoside recognition protein [Campylobacterota bacterium]|nr:nucleoside recognition protein [Campylobacterota bacterium]
MDIKETLNKSLKSAFLILKLIIPIYILADILYFYNILSYISFLIEPFTSFIGLPKEAALAIISGIFLNLYAAIAFAAPLDMTPHQWSILAVFLGVCHSLIVESVIMKKIGISNKYSYSLRFLAGLALAYITFIIPSEFFNASISSSEIFNKTTYDNIYTLLYNSIYDATLLSVKIILLITILIFIMDFIKTRDFIKKSKQNVSKSFSILVGVFLGITYGAGILIEEVKSNNISKKDIFYIATFLSICHAIIEDTLLFVIFGADFTMVIAIRTIGAIVLAYILTSLFYQL